MIYIVHKIDTSYYNIIIHHLVYLTKVTATYEAQHLRQESLNKRNQESVLILSARSQQLYTHGLRPRGNQMIFWYAKAILEFVCSSPHMDVAFPITSTMPKF